MERDHPSTSAAASQQSADTFGAEGPDVEQLTQAARETFGTDDKADKWLRRPTTALSGSSPLDVASAGPNGVRKVIDLLKRIDHGLSV